VNAEDQKKSIEPVMEKHLVDLVGITSVATVDQIYVVHGAQTSVIKVINPVLIDEKTRGIMLKPNQAMKLFVVFYVCSLSFKFVSLHFVSMVYKFSAHLTNDETIRSPAILFSKSH
jgi:hypothetical protein